MVRRNGRIEACEIPECAKPAPNGRLCGMHTSRKRRHGTTEPPKGAHASPRVRYERFVIRNAEGCWGWRGAVDKAGYASLSPFRAHRLSYELFKGPIPEGLSVLHHCDNPPCTNPDHLFVGTHADNMADATAKGRLLGRPNRPRGEAVKNSKLTEEKVRELRRLAAAGWRTVDLAARYGISEDAVWLVKAGKRWAHV